MVDGHCNEHLRDRTAAEGGFDARIVAASGIPASAQGGEDARLERDRRREATGVRGLVEQHGLGLSHAAEVSDAGATEGDNAREPSEIPGRRGRSARHGRGRQG